MSVFRNLFKHEAPTAIDDTAPFNDTAHIDDTAPIVHTARGCTNYCGELLPGCEPSMPIEQITCYGSRLQSNKAGLAKACAEAGVPPEMHALLVAMAMVETNYMCSKDRDPKKDCTTDGSKNVSLFNLNLDLVKSSGFKLEGSPDSLNDDVLSAVMVLMSAFEKWGILPTLDFVRGGATGFVDHVSYDCEGYRRTVATILTQIDQDPNLLTDSRRVEVQLPNVTHLPCPQ